jgi:hypothetical protein
MCHVLVDFTATVDGLGYIVFVYLSNVNQLHRKMLHIIIHKIIVVHYFWLLVGYK